jgi:hypothetical protein
MRSYASVAFVTAFLLAAVPTVSSAAAPAQPGVVRSEKLSKTEVLLTWNDRSNNEDNFEIQRLKEGGRVWRTRGFVPANVNQFIDTVSRQTVFRYRVRALNEDGASPFSNFCFVNRTPPNKPTGVTAVLIGLTRARISWDDTSSFETGFIIQRQEPGKGFKTIAVVPKNSTEYIDTGIEPASTYIYRVRAKGKPARCVKHSRFSKERIVTSKGGVRALNVSLGGTGKGTVTSSPAGIVCGPLGHNCAAEYPVGTQVILFADPNAKSKFKGWVGIPGCEDTLGPCSFRMGRDRSVSAEFKNLKTN